jgi:predicted nucleic acid-binding protein
VRTFFDSSAFAKRYIEESGSSAVDDLCAIATELAICVICIPEIISALNRRLRERLLKHQEYMAAKQFLSADVRDVVVINLVPEVISKCTLLLEYNPIRAMDALHLASAIEWGAELFVSSDRKQLAAAKKAGLRTKLV